MISSEKYNNRAKDVECTVLKFRRFIIHEGGSFPLDRASSDLFVRRQDFLPREYGAAWKGGDQIERD